MKNSLFVLRLNVPVNNFFSHVGTEPTLPGFNQYFRELMCLAQGYNTVTLVGIEPRTSCAEHDIKVFYMQHSIHTYLMSTKIDSQISVSHQNKPVFHKQKTKKHISNYAH